MQVETLNLFQQFLLVLMKLRLDLFDNDLAYRFRTSQATVSRYFNKWIDIMFVRFQPLVNGAREQIRGQCHQNSLRQSVNDSFNRLLRDLL